MKNENIKLENERSILTPSYAEQWVSYQYKHGLQGVTSYTFRNKVIVIEYQNHVAELNIDGKGSGLPTLTCKKNLRKIYLRVSFLEMFAEAICKHHNECIKMKKSEDDEEFKAILLSIKANRHAREMGID